MTILAYGIVAAFAVYIFRNYCWRIIRTNRRGTETDAYVCRIEEMYMSAAGVYADRFPQYYIYVRFRREDGRENEVRLLNPKGKLEQGSRIRIKYLNEMADYAILAENKAA